MVGTFADKRAQCIAKITNTLKQSQKDLNFIIYDRLIVEIQYEFGFTERKAKEYLEIAMRYVGASIDKTTKEIVFTN